MLLCHNVLNGILDGVCIHLVYWVAYANCSICENDDDVDDRLLGIVQILTGAKVSIKK